MKHSKLNQAEIERISEATGKSIYEVIKEKIMDSSGAREVPEINAFTTQKILCVCRFGAKRDIFSPAEMKGIERFLGVNARPKAAQEVPR